MQQNSPHRRLYFSRRRTRNLTQAGRSARITYQAAAGDLQGLVSSGRDLGLASYGHITAAAFAGRDLAWGWSVGAIDGILSANRNIVDVYAYGDITAALFAYDLLSGGGHVKRVQAAGPIDGLINASASIDYLASGDAVLAALTAPLIDTLIEYDTSLQSAVAPSPPDSGIAQILSDAGALYQDLLDWRDGQRAEAASIQASHLLDYLTTAADASDSEAAYQVIGVLFYDLSGAMGIYQAITGEDPVTLEKFTAAERFTRGGLTANGHAAGNRHRQDFGLTSPRPDFAQSRGQSR